MADLARLGFAVDTGALDQASAKLDKVSTSAKKAEGAASKFDAAINGAGSGSGVGQAAAGFDNLNNAVRKAGQGQSWFARRWETLLSMLRRTPAAAAAAQGSLQRLGAAANDNINRLQSTPGNVAAQFQDIGVTAAGGMQPYLIALQQGTQLAAAMQGGLRSLAGGILQMLSPLSLLTIGLVGVLAAWIQSVDWMKVAQSVQASVASGMDAVAASAQQLAPIVTALGAVLLVAFGPQIISAIASTGAAIVSMARTATVALWTLAAANPFTAIVLAAAALAAGIGYYMGVTMKQVSDAINFIVGGFVGAYNAIKKTWSMLPAALADSTTQAVNKALEKIEMLINKSATALNGFIAGLPPQLFGGSVGKIGNISLGRLGNSNAGAAQRMNDVATGEIKAAQGVDYVGKVGNAIKGAFEWGAAKVRGINFGGDEKSKTDKAASGGKTDAEKQTESFEKMRIASENYVRSKQAEVAALGLSERAAATLKHQTDLTNQAIQQGIPLDKARKDSIASWAAAMADADMKLANAQGWKRVQDDMRALDVQFQTQRAEIGMTAEASSRYKWETVWLNDQIRKLVEATPAQIAALQQAARGYADNEVRINAARDAMRMHADAINFASDATKGWVSDMRNALEQGKGFFASFANSVLNVLNKVIDKMLDLAISGAFQGNQSGLTGFIGGLFGGGKGLNLTTAAAPVVVPHAKGGVVDSPRFFNYASGRTGVMGEAGAEAIMPLKRGSDGSLGVAVNDNGRRHSAPAININQSFTISGAVTAGEVQQLVRSEAGRARDEAIQSIPLALSNYQRDGTM